MWNIALIMSGDGRTVCQLADSNADRIVLEKDTYLIDENNRVIPIPAGTVAVLERDTEKTAAAANSGSAGDVKADMDAVTPSATSVESEDQATNRPMPADSTSMVNKSQAAVESSESVVSTACEVVEATSSDPNTGITLSDMFVQEEEEVMDEPKDQETVVSGSGPVEGLTKSPPKDVGRKPGRRGSQKKAHKVPDESRVGVESEDPETIVSGSEPVKRSAKARSKDPAPKPRRRSTQTKMPDESPADDVSEEASVKPAKCSLSVDVEKPSLVSEKSAASSTSAPPAVATVSAGGRPQRSTPRRSVFEMLHGADLKPQRLSHAESEQESSGSRGHPSKKQKVSNPIAAEEQVHKRLEETKLARDPHRRSSTPADSEQEISDGRGGPGKKRKVFDSGTADEVKHKRVQETEVATELGTGASKDRPHSVQSTFQAPGGCEASSSSLDTTSSCLPSSCTPATGRTDLVQLASGGVENSVGKMDVDDSESEIRVEKPLDSVAHMSSKKQKQSKKSAEKRVTKKVVGKHEFGLKSAKIKTTKKLQVAGDDGGFKIPGMPYHYFTVDSNDHPDSESDDDSSAADDVASEDPDWMRRQIRKLEKQVCRLQKRKQTTQCWQDVLAEISDLPPEEVDEKLKLSYYERKLRALDRELDERASFLRVRGGCIARRERRILEKESKLKRKERELEHQRRLQGRVKLSPEPATDTKAGFVDSSSVPSRKQALEKEVRLELQKQELNRQKHVLDDTRKKLAARERELENREHALVDADLLNMASGFSSSRGTEANQNHPNGGAMVEFSDDDDDDFGGSFGAKSVKLPFSLDGDKHESDDDDQPELTEVS